MSQLNTDSTSRKKYQQPLNIVMVQEVFQVGDIKSNADKIIHAAISAADEGADLVVFPELALVGYPPEDLLFRRGFLDQVKHECLRIQHVLKDVIGDSGVVFGLPYEHAGKLYNAAIYLNEGIIRQFCFKQSLPNYSVFDEVRYFSPGHESSVIEVKGHTIGLMICEDVWQSEIVERSIANGARAIIAINASPFHINKHEERIAILKSHANQFEVPIMYLNMVGGQDELVFDGDSLAVDRQANVVARARLFDTDVIKVVFDGSDITSMHPMAPEEGSDAVTYKALVTGVRDFVRQNGFAGVVVGLSGGVDSALTLAIAVDALGSEAVRAVMMPYKYTSSISIEDAEAQARLLGVE